MSNGTQSAIFASMYEYDIWIVYTFACNEICCGKSLDFFLFVQTTISYDPVTFLHRIPLFMDVHIIYGVPYYSIYCCCRYVGTPAKEDFIECILLDGSLLAMVVCECANACHWIQITTKMSPFFSAFSILFGCAYNKIQRNQCAVFSICIQSRIYIIFSYV